MAELERARSGGGLMVRLRNLPGHPRDVDERQRRTAIQRRGGKRLARFVVTVRGAVPTNIIDLVGQAHATAILTAPTRSSRSGRE